MSLDYPLNQGLKQLQRINFPRQSWLPIVLAIPRPRPLIGMDSSMEFLNFAINISDQRSPMRGEWKTGAPVQPLIQLQPATVRLANELSNTYTGKLVSSSRGMVMGCGALGAKIALNLARAGQINLTLVDSDSLMPHNLIRHDLFDSEGSNKARATKAAIEKIYSWDKENVHIEALEQNALDVLFLDSTKKLQAHHWLLDCTASVSILNALVDPRLSRIPRVFRAEIADKGRLGFLLVEGKDRNPRIDDLRAALYDRALEDERIATWLNSQREETEKGVGPALEEISIGLGCSSTTMRMANDQVA